MIEAQSPLKPELRRLEVISDAVTKYEIHDKAEREGRREGGGGGEREEGSGD